MGIGVSTKGNSSGNRGRPYGMMLLLAFGAAIFGVMVLHKFRERRIFNLLVKQKDRELFSLQLFLQKERDSTKELKRKTEEMRTKIYSLRTQKMELDSRLLEMQSSITSLKDEQRTMESAMEEKQNEIKMLREREIDLGKENPQVRALTEILKQKESEIEDLKHRVEYPVNVWSVSTDDPSNPPVNSTARGSTAQKDRTNYKDGDNSTRGEGGSENESTNQGEGENLVRAKYGSENGLGITDRRVMTGEEQLQKLENSRDEGSQDGGAAGHMGKLKNSEDTVGREIGMISRGEMKLEISDNSLNGAGLTARGRHGYGTKTKGKRWRIIAKNRGSEHNEDSENMGAGSMRSRRFFKTERESERFKALREEKPEKSIEHQGRNIDLKMRDKSSPEGREEEAASNEGQMERKGGENGKDNRMQVKKAVVTSEDKLPKPQNPEDMDDQRNKAENADKNHWVEKDHEIVSTNGNSGKSHYSPNGDILTNRSANGEASNVIGDAGNIESNNGEQAKVADEDEEVEDLEVADIHERDAANGDVFREAGSKMEEDIEEYKEETDESEF